MTVSVLRGHVVVRWIHVVIRVHLSLDSGLLKMDMLIELFGLLKMIFTVGNDWGNSGMLVHSWVGILVMSLHGLILDNRNSHLVLWMLEIVTMDSNDFMRLLRVRLLVVNWDGMGDSGVRSKSNLWVHWHGVMNYSLMVDWDIVVNDSLVVHRDGVDRVHWSMNNSLVVDWDIVVNDSLVVHRDGVYRVDWSGMNNSLVMDWDSMHWVYRSGVHNSLVVHGDGVDRVHWSMDDGLVMNWNSMHWVYWCGVHNSLVVDWDSMDWVDWSGMDNSLVMDNMRVRLLSKSQFVMGGRWLFLMGSTVDGVVGWHKF